MLHQLASGLETGDAATVLATMTDHVTLRVAVHDEPLAGKPAASHITAVLDGVLHDIRVLETIAHPQGAAAVMMFTALVARHPGAADGALVIRLDPQEGRRICDLTVFVRPLAALQALADEMGRRLGGQRPDGSAR